MHPVQHAAEESERLAALARYNILDTPPDGAFDRIAALAARLLGTPIGIISLVDVDRIWFKSRHGLDTEQVPRDPGLCASAILGEEAYVLRDASTDPRSMSNPLVAGAHGFRFYAGVPLRTEDGHGLGVLCVLDVVPRSVSEDHLATLRDLAVLVMDQMELRLAARRVDQLHQELSVAHAELHHQASHDPLTGVWNRRAIMAMVEQAYARAARHGEPLALLMLDVDFFKRVNDTHGHPVGDQVLQVVADRLHAALRTGDAIGRTGGEEFLALLSNCDGASALEVAERCRAAICAKPIKLADPSRTALNVSVSVGLAVLSPHTGAPVSDAIALADGALYRAKHAGRNRVERVAA